MSPVIGVILMVAITVILAAVIGTFVLGLGDQIGGSATAGVTVDGDTVTLANTGTADYVYVTDSDGQFGDNMSNVGDSVNLTSGSGTAPYQIIAVGENGEQSLLRTVESIN
ncbi:type IV pilin [Halorubrum ezzemoulense]|uniref:type IV pilin n=2 Tax=Halorubrum ezzemoulense TaxID=337243 RepID=UPI003CCD24F5